MTENNIQCDVFPSTQLTLRFIGPQHMNWIRLWYPEFIKSDQGCLTFQPEGEWYAQPWLEGQLLREYASEVKGNQCSFKGRVFKNELGFGMEIKIQNLTSVGLMNVRPIVCMQLAAAPDFADPEMIRTYVRVDGSPMLLCETRRENHDFRTQKYIHRDISDPLPDDTKVLFDGCNHWGTSPTRVDSPLVLTASKVSDWIVGIRFDSPHSIENNAKPSLACLHSTPCVDCISPGETATYTGQILILRGTVADAFSKHG